MKLTANHISTSYSESGQQLIMLALTAKTDIADLKAVIADKKLLAVEISKQKKKRSLDANSYAWVLITKIADTLRTSKEELYIEMLKRYGQREKELISIIDDEKALEMIHKALNNHCCVVGEGSINGKQFKHLAVLIGSSQYDTRQMAILIDGIVSEAKGLDIETLTPKELQELKSSWK
jgi:hypothetical protein